MASKRLPGWVEDMFEGVLPPDHETLEFVPLVYHIPEHIEPFDFDDENQNYDA